MPIHHIDILPTGNTSNPVQGSVILNFDEAVNDKGIDYIRFSINNIGNRKINYTDCKGEYIWTVVSGNTVSILFVTNPTDIIRRIVDIYRKDYTCDDVDGNLGITTTYITGFTGNTGTSTSNNLLIAPPSNAYNFEYIYNVKSEIIGTPTPTPTLTATPTPTPSPTPTLTSKSLYLQYFSNLTGSTWSLPSTPAGISAFFAGGTDGIKYVMQKEERTGGGLLTYGKFYYSYDANTWIQYPNNITGFICKFIYYDANRLKWLLLGENGTLYETTNFNTYTLLYTFPSFAPSYVMFDGVHYWFTGGGTFKSTDLISFLVPPIFASSIAWNGSMYIAKGRLNGVEGMLKSTNGVDWIVTTGTPFQFSYIFKVMTDGTNFITYGGDFGGTGIRTVAYKSTNGTTWTEYTPLQTYFSDPTIGGYVSDMMYNGTAYMASGKNFNTGLGRDGIAYSTTFNGTYLNAAGDSGVPIQSQQDDGFNANYFWGYPTQYRPTNLPTPTPNPLPYNENQIFYYDPSNIISYPGTGNTIYDLTRNKLNATKFSGTTFVGGLKPYFKFSGYSINDQYITGATINAPLNNFTLWMAVWRDSITNGDRFFESGPLDIGSDEFATNNDLYYSPRGIFSTPAMTTGNWMFIAIVDGDGSNYLRQIYNYGGTPQFVSATGSTLYTNYYTFDTARIGGSTNFNLQGRIGPVVLWDRRLTTTELNVVNDYYKTIYMVPDPTSTPTPSGTPTPSPTVTNTPTPSPTATNTPTPTASGPTPTPSPDLPNIIQSGLTIYVDGSNSSYSGSGTTWYSRATGTTYNGTINGGPTWTTSQNGFFTFDGVNDWVDFGLSSKGLNTDSYTYGGWVKCVTGSTQEVFFQRGLDGLGFWSLQLDKTTTNKIQASFVSSAFVQTNAVSTTTMVSNQWYYVIGRWTAGSGITISINGTSEVTTSDSATTLRNASGSGWVIALENADYDAVSVGDFEMYNRALSDAEILSNFNAKKTLYGY